MANIRISPDCEQFGCLDQAGYLCLWRFQSGSDMPLPFSRLQCHTKRGADLCFVDSTVVLATVGVGGGGSLCLWDALLPAAQAQVASCPVHPDGAHCIVHCAAERCLVSGGERGEMAIFDLRQRRVREKWAAHSMAVQALTLVDGRWCFSASADSDLKLWSIDAPCAADSADDADEPSALAEGLPRGTWAQAHEPHTLLAPLVGTRLGHCGLTALTMMPTTMGAARAMLPGMGLISGGADGRVKLWHVSRSRAD